MQPPRLNDRDGLTRDYRGLLVAEVTAVATPTSGALAGRRVYSWIEQTLTPATAAYEAAEPARRGVYVSPTDFNNVLLDANDTEIAVGRYVWARMLGLVGGTTVYETVTLNEASGSTSSPLSNCLSAFAGWLEDACLELTVLAGADPGKCANIAAAGPITMQPFGGYVWVADSTFPVAGGDALATISEGADGNPAASLAVWTGSAFEEVAGKFVGCSGGAMEFAFRGVDLLCDDTGVACGDNTVRIRAACVACEGPEVAGVCDEAECPDGAPGAYTFTLAGGATDFEGLNGTWAIVYDAGVWTATRGGWTGTLTFSGTAATLRFEFDADPTNLFVEYALDPRPEDCCDDITVAYDSHAGTGTRPTGPTLAAVGECGDCPVATACCPDGIPAEITVTFGGTLSSFGSVPLTYDAGATPAGWVGTVAVGCDNTEVTINFACTGGPPPPGGDWLITGGETGGTAFSAAVTVTCSGPFSGSAAGSIPPGGIAPNCSAGAYTITLTE